MALFVTRWPEWNPPEQEKRDWRTMTNNWSWTRLEEAMLQVRMSYSSKIPQMKWIRDAYFRLRDEERKANDTQSYQQQFGHPQGQDPQVQLDREQCMCQLLALPPNHLQEAIRLAQTQSGRFLAGKIPTEVSQMSWLHRFAVLFAFEESSSDIRHSLTID
tara:strand:- start:216 stop:695 length:480 start_codon:yes stop_codon:yes gene_type:complete